MPVLLIASGREYKPLRRLCTLETVLQRKKAISYERTEEKYKRKSHPSRKGTEKRTIVFWTVYSCFSGKPAVLMEHNMEPALMRFIITENEVFDSIFIKSHHQSVVSRGHVFDLSEDLLRSNPVGQHQCPPNPLVHRSTVCQRAAEHYSLLV